MMVGRGSTIAPPGGLWTVNWHALLNKPDILFRNERHINILDTANFGRLGFVEIGALSVGRIVQVHGIDAPYTRGQEKSVFRFGGSAIAVFGEPGRWRPTADLLENTAKGIETLLRLGSLISRRLFRVSNQRGFSDVGGQEGRWSF